MEEQAVPNRDAASEPDPDADGADRDPSEIVAQIECLDAENPEMRPIPPEGLVVGRDPHCDIVVEGRLFPQVSGRHVRVRVGERAVHVEDLSSKNGTLLDGRLIQKAGAQIGQVFQLGNQGPRFRIVGPNGERSITATVSVGELVGAAQASGPVSVSPEPPRRRPLGLWIALAAVGLAAAAAGGAFVASQWGDDGRSSAEYAALEEKLHALEGLARRLEASPRTSDGELAGHLREVRAAREELATLERGADPSTVKRLEAELEALRLELERLRVADGASPDEVLGRVRPAVVQIEIAITFVDRESGKTLHRDGSGDANLSDRGEPVRFYQVGSGFCIDARGYLVTNQHVVTAPDLDLEGSGFRLDPKLEITAVFSGETQRRTAQIVELDAAHDLALLRVDSFGRIPVVPTVDLEVGLPEPGHKVWLIAFPYGENRSASVFEGIVSNADAQAIQVTTGIHKGTSGGPLIDRTGRVVGVARGRFQETSGGAAEPRLGFCVPIARLGSVWPPKDSR